MVGDVTVLVTVVVVGERTVEVEMLVRVCVVVAVEVTV